MRMASSRSANAQGEMREIKFDNLDSMLPGNLLLLLYQETKEPKYKLAADRIRKRFETYPRTKDGGFWHATSKSREWQLWGDGVFMSMPFLVRYGNMFGDSKYANDEAVHQLLTYANHLNDPRTGLMFHAYDESGQSTWADKETKHSAEIWCRAMGWFGMTLIESPRALASRSSEASAVDCSSRAARESLGKLSGQENRSLVSGRQQRRQPDQLARDVELEHVHVRHGDGHRSWLREQEIQRRSAQRIRRCTHKDLSRSGRPNKHHGHLRRHQRRRSRLLLRAQAKHKRLSRSRCVSDHEREVYEQNAERQQQILWQPQKAQQIHRINHLRNLRKNS